MLLTTSYLVLIGFPIHRGFKTQVLLVNHTAESHTRPASLGKLLNWT